MTISRVENACKPLILQGLQKNSKNISTQLLIAILFISVQYPFYFKLDYAKASIMAILPYIVCFAIGIPLVNYLMNNQVFYHYIMSMVVYFRSNVLAFILIVLAISFLSVTFSYLLSRKIQKREF